MRLAGGITGAAASLIVDTVTGLPSVPFTLMLDPGQATEEIVEVTAAGGTTLTVTRGVDGTSAQAHLNGGEVRHAYSARDFQDSRNHEANTTTAHGVTGAVAGTTNTQALTNKDLTSGTNTFPSTLATLTGAQTLTNKVIDGLPLAGFITMQAGVNVRAGWLSCDGSSVLRADYPDLNAYWAAEPVPYPYGSVDGTHMTLPALADMFPRGNAVGTANSGGAATHQHAMTSVTVTAHTHSESMALPTHTHIVPGHNHGLAAGYAALDMEGATVFLGRIPCPATFLSNIHTTITTVVAGSTWVGNATALGGTTDIYPDAWSGGSTAATVTGTTGAASANTLTGSADAGSSLPPYVGVNFIIKT